MGKDGIQKAAETGIITNESVKVQITAINSDIALAESTIRVFEDEIKVIKAKLKADPLALRLKSIKELQKKMMMSKNELISEYNGIRVLLLKDFMPGATMFEKQMALVLNEVKGDEELIKQLGSGGAR